MKIHRAILSMLILPILSLISLALSPALAQDPPGWYPFQPAEDLGPSVLGMENWLETPAGVHGPVKMQDDAFVFADGTPVKFWGVNLGNADCAPPKAHGERWAQMKAKYGVNCVRLHKFIGPGRGGIGDPQDSTKFDPQSIDELDYFCAQLKERGIYYGWSWVFGHKVRPGDKDKLDAYDEIIAAGGDTNRIAVFIAEDVQDLRIDMIKALLNHRNPYTGLTYAEDPALAFIEFQNEDSIFFYTFRGYNDMSKLPTYKRKFNARFSEFLQQKYGNHEALVQAWGEKAMNAYEEKKENLADKNIMVQGNPWFFSPPGLEQAKNNGTYQRLLDTAAFLYQAQSKFYHKFQDAIRKEGYNGPLVGSCWHTPPGLPMYYNLLTDYEIGLIDRHSYFGKGTHGYRPQPGKFGNESQLDSPGSGILSKGLLQVDDRPFALSEWTTVFPNEWNIESPAIMAAYGLGLQGWDASYDFASHSRTYGNYLFAKRLSDPRLWVVDTPNQIGLYPLLARMVYRGDVEEGEIVSTRYIDPEQLRKGQPEWIHEETTTADWDFTDYQGKVPAAALAAGRVVVDFVEEPKDSVFPDMSKYLDGNTIISSTKQLKWRREADGQRGYFTIDTDGTLGVVGHLPDEPVEAGKMSVSSSNPFAIIAVTSTAKDKTLQDCETALLVAMARVRNTGMVIDGEQLKQVGKGPMLMEPVEADITLSGRRIKEVRLLDHDGRATESTLELKSPNAFSVNGVRDKTFYYQVVFE
ncbi:MAG: hypothetical protein ACOC2L_04095 [Candidatus Sumerlaeota bacterium]